MALLRVEKEPDTHDALEVLLAHLLEVRLGAIELLLALLFQHLEVEREEALHSGSVLELQALHIGVQCFKGLAEPLIHLGPLHWEVILDEDSDHERKLLVAGLGQDDVFRVVDHSEQLSLDLCS